MLDEMTGDRKMTGDRRPEIVCPQGTRRKK